MYGEGEREQKKRASKHHKADEDKEIKRASVYNIRNTNGKDDEKLTRIKSANMYILSQS